MIKIVIIHNVCGKNMQKCINSRISSILKVFQLIPVNFPVEIYNTDQLIFIVLSSHKQQDGCPDERDNPTIHIWVSNMLTIKKIIYIQLKYNNDNYNWIFVKTCNHHTRPVWLDLYKISVVWYSHNTTTSRFLLYILNFTIENQGFQWRCS